MSGPLDFGDEPPRDAATPPPVRPRPERPVARPPGASRYGWIIGVVGFVILVYITLNTFTGEDIEPPKADRQIPPFAVPLALSDLEGDANVAVKDDQGQAGKRRACSVRGPRILNVCELYERGPVVVIFFVARGGARCTQPLDQLNRVVRDFPGVSVAAVAIRGKRDQARRVTRERGWSFGVGYDRDGVIASLYGVVDCGHITYVRRGGKATGTSLGGVGERELRLELERLSAP